MSFFSRLFRRGEREPEREPRRASTAQATPAPKVTIDVPTDEVALRVFDESHGGTVEQFYAAMSRDLIERHGLNRPGFRGELIT